MGRSVKKGPYIDHHLGKKIDHAKSSGDKKVIKTWSRASPYAAAVAFSALVAQTDDGRSCSGIGFIAFAPSQAAAVEVSGKYQLLGPAALEQTSAN